MYLPIDLRSSLLYSKKQQKSNYLKNLMQLTLPFSLYRQITKREYIDGLVILADIHSPYESNWQTSVWETARKVH